jgi:hypothetical protein
MPKKEAFYWVLTFLACAAMVLGTFVGVALLVSYPTIDGKDQPSHAVSEATRIASETEATLRELELNQGAPQEEDWARRVCDNLKIESIPENSYEVVSQRLEPSPQGCRIAVVQSVHKVAEGSGGTRTVPRRHTYTVVVSAGHPGGFTVAVLQNPEPGEARSGEPTVMVRTKNGAMVERFVATPEFWKQAEPDLLAAFPGRSINETPLPQFFEPFNRK